MAGEQELADEDRLPWLETVDEDYEDDPSPLRVALLVLLGLAILAAIVFAYFRSQQHFATGPDGQGQIIAAQPGAYKVRPDQPGGMKVEGQGDTAFATSQGRGGNGAIDLNAVPEAPVQGKRATTQTQTTGATSSTTSAAIPTAATPLRNGGPAHAATPGSGTGGGAIVQLGAFPSEAAANAAWNGLAKRFAYLAPLAKVVQPADVNGGKTYRLRVNTGSADQATTLCGKLKVAGEACFIPQS